MKAAPENPESRGGPRREAWADLSPARRRLLELRLRERGLDATGAPEGATAGPSPGSPLVAIRPAGTRPPLVCLHDSSGQVWAYRDLAGRLDPSWPIYGLQVPGAEMRSGWRTLADLVRIYVREIRRLAPEGPYFLLGSCSGGLLAHAVACELHAQGETPGLVVLVDPTAAFPAFRKNYRTWPRRLLNLALVESSDHLRNVLSLSGRERRAYIQRRARRLFTRIRRRFAASAADESKSAEAMEQAVLEAMRDFSPGPFPGRVVLFQSRRFPLGTQPQLSRGWDRAPIGELVVHRHKGFTGFAIKEPRLRRWVHLLNAELDRAAGTVKSGRQT